MLDERSKDASSTNEILRPDVDNIILQVLLDGSLLNVLCAMTPPDVLSHESYDTCRSLASMRSNSQDLSQQKVSVLSPIFFCCKLECPRVYRFRVSSLPER